ncbi:MAG: helical backbone metal receptor [Kiritimatiellae bacterium]|nr:helical backbone metal receptor [Kiritimatiellia bacterium]
MRTDLILKLSRPVVSLCFMLASGCDLDIPASQAAATNLDSPPRRLVCGSPAVTEIVFALGCGDRVVGVSDYTSFPPEACLKPRVGGLVNPNRERLLALRADCIITQGRHEALASFSAKHSVRLHSVCLDSLADILTAVGTIAQTLAVDDRGSALQDQIRNALAQVASRRASVPPQRTLLLLGRIPGDLTGLTTVGPETFLDDLLTLAGGSNIFADATGAYPQVSKETLLVRQPEVVLELHPGGMTDKVRARLLADWTIFADMPAVRQSRVHFLTNDFMLVPGPRVAQIAQVLANAITGEAQHE